MDRSQLPFIAAFIELLAVRSEAFADMVGVGASETAGHLISYLAEHPKDLEPWLNRGFGELPDDWILKGQLTYMVKDGKVVSPQYARHHQIITAMQRRSHD